MSGAHTSTFRNESRTRRDLPRAREPEIRWIGLGAPAAFLALAIVAGVAALALWSQTLFARDVVAEQTPVEVALGERRLVVPRAWLIGAETGTRANRPVGRIAMEAPLRDFLDLDTVAPDLAIGLTLVAADEAPAPSDRPTLLYNRFLTPGAEPTADGLVRRTFAADSPYAGEILVLAPPHGRSFAARCLEGEAALGVRLPCLAELRRSGLDLQIRLPRAGLTHWARIVAVVDGMAMAPTRTGALDAAVQ